MKFLLFALLLAAPALAEDRFARFDLDLAKIRTELGIPKISAAIVESGHVVWRNGGAVTGAPLRHSAAAVRVMQLADKGRISLDDPAALPQGASVRQVLSYTADGSPGEEYLYNRDFLEALIPAFEKLSRKPIRAPATMDALIQFAIALDGNALVSSKSKAIMFAPVRSTRGEVLPSALGWFSQSVSGESVVWDFAQDGESSSLFVKIPGRKLTLIALADSKAMTEAAELEDGNILRSAIALAFLEDVVFLRAFSEDDMETRALTAFSLGKRDESAAVLHQALEKFPGLESTDDLTLLHLLSALHFKETESAGTAVITVHPSLPPAWFYYGKFLRDNRRFRESTICFHHVTDHQPPWHHWSVEAAKRELSTLE